MAFANNTGAVSLWKTMRRQARGFGSRNLGLEGTDSPAEVFGLRLRHDNNGSVDSSARNSPVADNIPRRFGEKYGYC
jgi:hypothetical protein